MKKRGQLQLSFGMIFSIILIVVTLAVAGYFITQALGIFTKVNCKLFYEDLQRDIDKAWYADGSTSKLFIGQIPSSANGVCFGNSSSSILESKDREKFDEFSFLVAKGGNMFFYPKKDSCKEGEVSYKLKHARFSGFFCVPVNNGKVSIKLAKKVEDALVQISK